MNTTMIDVSDRDAVRIAIYKGVNVVTPEGLEILRMLPATADTVHDFEVGSFVLYAPLSPSFVWLAEVVANEGGYIEVETVDGELRHLRKSDSAPYGETHTELTWWQSQGTSDTTQKHGDIFAITEIRKAAWLAGETQWQLYDQFTSLRGLLQNLFASGLLTRDRLNELEEVASDPEVMQVAARCEVAVPALKQRVAKLTRLVNSLQRIVNTATGTKFIDFRVEDDS